MQHKIGLGIGIVGVLVGLGVMLYSRINHDLYEVHYHAGFRVYIDNELQNYSDYQYMNYTPCSEHNTKKSEAEEQLEKAHLHDNVGDVVHVHRSGAKWGDLFKNIKVNFLDNKRITGYIDGVEVEEIMEAPIESYTTLILLVGESEPNKSQERIERAYIETIEAKSELCGK